MRFFIALTLCMGLFGCSWGTNIYVKGIDFRESEIRNDGRIDFEAIVSMGDLKLPNTNSHILFEKNQDLGEFITEQLKDGTSRLAATIELNKLPQFNASKAAHLPNSREIPIILDNPYPVQEFQIFENSRIYLGGSKNNSLLIGFAFNIPAFDHILANDHQRLNLFEDFRFSSSISGSAGIFTSPDSGQNGFAIFTKKTFGINKNPLRNPASSVKNDFDQAHSLSFLQLNYLFTKRGTLRIK